MSPFLIPILISLGAFVMIFGIYYLKTKENMAMIEKGMNPKLYNSRPTPYKGLKTGLLLLGAGSGLLIAYLMDQNLQDFSDKEAIYFAMLAIGGGIGLIISYRFEKKVADKIEERTKKEEEELELN